MIDAYILVFAAFLLTIGARGDRFGRKRALQSGLVLFTIGSVAAAFSVNTSELIAARAFSGLAGASILPATLSLITASFSAKERPQAIAAWAAVFGLGVGLGPAVGGWLIQHFDWNSVFFVNVPVIIVALIGGQILIAESKDPHPPKVDVLGVVLSVIGLFALVYGIVDAGSAGWTDPTVLASLAVGIVFLAVFGWWENRNPDAMLPIEFFRNMSFTGANLTLILISFSLFGSIFFLSQYFQSVLGYGPFQSGLAVLPNALGITFAATLSARLSKRFGIKIVVAAGTIIGASALLFMSQTFKVDSPYIVVGIAEVMLGLGLGMAISPATNSVMGSGPVAKAGIGSAMNDTTRQLGGAMGVAILGTVLNTIYLDRITPLLAEVQTTLANIPLALVSQEQRDQLIHGIKTSVQGAILIADKIGSNPAAGTLGQDIRSMGRAAFVAGMTQAMLIGSIIMYASVILIVFLLPNKVRRAEDMQPAHDQAVGEMPILEGAAD